MKILKLAGHHHEMGRQHGHRVRDLRPLILQVMRERLAQLEQREIDVQPHVAELASVWEVAARSTLDMLRGIAEALEFEWDDYFRYTIASYLEDRTRRPAHPEGCTTWAAAAPITRDGVPILAKNRDYRPDHQPLQCLARARPAQGYRYAYVTSAGSPAVFSSGLNEVGLAVADTHVTSLDIGPGVARYSVEMELLEHHSRVSSALDYLREVSHMGDGTLVLIDATGDMAVFETGHTACGIVRPERGFVVSTNHFVTAPLCDRWVDRGKLALRGNSENRRAKVAAALAGAGGQVDVAWAQQLLADHEGGPAYAICRHHLGRLGLGWTRPEDAPPDVEPQSATISTVLYLPWERMLFVANGRPCQVAFRAWPVV